MKHPTAKKILTDFENYDKFLKRQNDMELKKLRLPVGRKSLSKAEKKSFHRQKTQKSQNSLKPKSRSTVKKNSLRPDLSLGKLTSINLSSASKSPLKSSLAKKGKIKKFNFHQKHSIIVESPTERKPKMKIKENLPADILKSKKKRQEVIN